MNALAIKLHDSSITLDELNSDLETYQEILHKYNIFPENLFTFIQFKELKLFSEEQYRMSMNMAKSDASTFLHLIRKYNLAQIHINTLYRKKQNKIIKNIKSKISFKKINSSFKLYFDNKYITDLSFEKWRLNNENTRNWNYVILKLLLVYFNNLNESELNEFLFINKIKKNEFIKEFSLTIQKCIYATNVTSFLKENVEEDFSNSTP